MGYSIREQSDEQQDPREEFLVEYQEETPLEIQEIQLEAVAREYLDNHFPNCEKQLFPTKARNFKSASGKMTSIGKIIKEISIPPELLALGHKVSGLCLAIDQNKVAAVLLKPVPKNIKEMQSFLGFASYYRNHIRNFAPITSSLYKLCAKDVVFEITKERRDAYERIKNELTNAPVLILPDFELPFKL
ncbi:hypothetical protein O181_037801 [Austropuccinia psidii MF-1]|uniref:Reverse transcriptase/retrotransposon-derived protein RNase H-like domain-containing protein n=1 Tax=Austropuccinia psidii MF-1 TaxID=1389203 RepID=A0A9Q3HB47_9BASI|nr:hypothetical protein [Austropuccinia psidii MF-1]